MSGNEFMRRAAELAVENVRLGRGGPFGAVVVRDGRVIATGTNLVPSSNDPTAHAEIVAIRAACKALQSFQLAGCDLYTSSEPCPMCMGAIYWARPARVFFGSSCAEAAAHGFDDAFIYEELHLPHAQRRIPLIPLPSEEAAQAFREWERKGDKIRY